MGNTLNTLKVNFHEFSDAWKRGKIIGEEGIIDTFFSKKSSENIMTPELMDQFKEFQNWFNNSPLSIDVIKKSLGDVDSKILDYAKTCKKGEMTTAGFEASLEKIPLSTKLGSMGLQALATAGNMLISWVASAALQFATEKLYEMANASKIAKEKAEGFAASASTAMQNMSNNANTIAGLNAEYQSLAKGVNNLGENVSLSAEQYARYKEIIGQVSDIMPGMATRFNSQGEAIAFTSGKLDDLTKSYENYMQAQAKEFVTKGDEDGNTFQDVLDNFNNNSEMGTGENFWNTFKNSVGFYDEDDLPVDTMIGTLKELQGKTKEEVVAFLKDVDFDANGQYMQTEGNRPKHL